MCVSARASILSFFTNLVSCLALVKYGNSNLHFYNITIALWMTYVSLMQFIDLGIWVDLDCKKGINKLATILGPLLNHTQPIAFFLIVYLLINKTKVGSDFYKNNLKSQENEIFRHFNIGKGGVNFIKILNILYVLFLIISLIQYYYKGSTSNPELFCSKLFKPNNILSWPWYNKNLLLIAFSILWHIFIINSLSVNPKSSYMKVTIVVIYTLLFLSFYLKNKNAGEFWCYIVNFGAILFLLIQKIFPKYLN